METTFKFVPGDRVNVVFNETKFPPGEVVTTIRKGETDSAHHVMVRHVKPAYNSYEAGPVVMCVWGENNLVKA